MSGDPLPPAIVPAPVARAPLRGPLLAFALDAALALAVMMALMTAGFVAWGMWRALELAGESGAALPPSAVEAQLGTPTPLALIVMTLASMGGASLLLYFLRRRASAAERARSHAAARRPRTWGWAIAAGVATFALSSIATSLGRWAGLEPDPSNLELIRPVFAQHPVFLGLFVVALAPVYEELLFRRVLFGRLWDAGRPALGLALSSGAFALAHEMPGTTGNDAPTTLLLLGVYAAMGAVFALVYRRTGTLWAPVAAHMLNNAMALAVLQLYGG